MDIQISDVALKWFKEEFGLKRGDMVKFYSQIYGTSPIQQSFALGFSKDNTPVNMAVSTEIDGITFYIEESSEWFFDGHDFSVDYNEKNDEIEFTYNKSKNRCFN